MICGFNPFEFCFFPSADPIVLMFLLEHIGNHCKRTVNLSKHGTNSHCLQNTFNVKFSLHVNVGALCFLNYIGFMKAVFLLS